MFPLTESNEREFVSLMNSISNIIVLIALGFLGQERL